MNLELDNTAEIVYPESDGKPMADNTLQWDWMVRIVEELREQYLGQQVFVAGNLFWYPVEGDPRTVTAPDGMVAFGRPPGYRGSYKQWEEDNIAPQVVFEVLSPTNDDEEMAEKLAFYNRHGVEEYYFIDPYEHGVEIYVRRRRQLREVEKPFEFVSPRLGIRFVMHNGELQIHGSDGRVFRDRIDRVAEEQSRTKKATTRAKKEAKRANVEAKRAKEERAANELLMAKLRELGVNPEDVLRPGK